MKLLTRIFAGIAIVGYGYTAYRSAPLLWQHEGALTTICVLLAISMMMVIFAHDVLFGRSIFKALPTDTDTIKEGAS